MARLFVLTSHDQVTAYMADRWAVPTYQQGVSSRGDSSLLSNPTRADVESALAGKRVVAFFGHGAAESLGSPALIDRANIHLATGVVVAVACRSGQVLGPVATSSGSETYVGFVDDIPVIDSPVIDSLISDSFARLASGSEAPNQFEASFKSACEYIQDEYFSVRRDDEAFLIGQSAQVLKMALRVLEA